MKNFLLLLFVSAIFNIVFAQTNVRSDSLITRYIESQNINISNNNSLVLLTSGKEKFKDMFVAIKEAKHSVHLEYFNFRNDSIAGALFDLLKGICK